VRLILGASKKALQFFYQPSAFTLRGVLSFILEMVGVVAAVYGAQLFFRAPTVEAKNVDPVAYIDLRAFREAYERSRIPVPQRLLDSLYGLAEVEPSDRPVILCWYHPARSSAREAEVRAASGRLARPRLEKPDNSIEYTLDEYRSRLASTSRPPTEFLGLDELPIGVVTHLKDFSSPGAPLDAWRVLRPSDPASPRFDRSTWAEWSVLGVESGAVLRAVEMARLSNLELRAALEVLLAETWVLNRLQLRNTSAHASASDVAVEVNHTGNGPLEYLGGDLRGEMRGREAFYSRIDRLLPGEARTALFRTRYWSIGGAGIRKNWDPSLVFDPAIAGVLSWVIVVLSAFWFIGNILLRTVLAAWRPEDGGR
jgi:hypothetical protein